MALLAGGAALVLVLLGLHFGINPAPMPVPDPTPMPVPNPMPNPTPNPIPNPGGPLERPTALNAVRTTPQSIALNWIDQDKRVAKYVIERRAEGSRHRAHFKTTAATYTDSGVDPQTRYTYRVLAQDAKDVSDYSTSVRVDALPPPLPQPLETPTGLTSSDISPQSVVLTWTDHDTQATGFEVQRQSDSGQSVSLPASASPFTDTGLAPGSHYTYQVCAVDQDSNRKSDYSAAISITTAAPPPPAEVTLTVNTNHLEFGSVAVNAPDQRSRPALSRVLLTNPGTEAVQIQVAGPQAPFRLMNRGSSFSLAPGRSQLLVLGFLPTATGRVDGSLRVMDDANNTLQIITLNGTGTQSQPVIPRILDRRRDPRGLLLRPVRPQQIPKQVLIP